VRRTKVCAAGLRNETVICLDLTGWEFAAWGAAGSFAVVGLEVVAGVKETGKLPWGRGRRQTQTVAFFVSFVWRLTNGAIVAAASGLGGAVSGVFGAFGAGIAAPLVVEKLGQSYNSLTTSGKLNEQGLASSKNTDSLTVDGEDQ
jgi:hypothetical protein